MKKLLFLSRLAMISNVYFAISLVLLKAPHLISSEEAKSTIGVLGWFLAPFLSLAATIGAVFLLSKGKPYRIPIWLAVANFVFLLAEIFVHFIL